MFDSFYKYMPLVGFFVYLKRRYKLETLLLIGTGLTMYWLMRGCGFRNPLFIHLSAILVEGMYVLFVWHVIARKSRVFKVDVPFSVWISGVTAITVFVIGIIAYMYIELWMITESQ